MVDEVITNYLVAYRALHGEEKVSMVMLTYNRGWFTLETLGGLGTKARMADIVSWTENLQKRAIERRARG